MRKFQTRQMNVFGAPDDFRSIVMRRLVALDYFDGSGDYVTLSSDGSSVTGVYPVGDPGNPNTGANGIGSTSITPIATPLTPAPGTAQASSSTSWISGLGSLFGSIGSAVVNVSRAATTSTINPKTGLPYTINPATGLPFTAPAASTQNMVLILLVVVVMAFVFLKR